MPLPQPNPWVDALPTPKPIVGPHNAPPGDLLLHLGEAWYPPAPSVLAELSALCPGILRYPDSQSTQLREELARYVGHGVHPDQILTGNGSDALIDQLVTTFAGPDRPVIAPAPTFFVYGASAALRRAPILTAGRRHQADGFALDPQALFAQTSVTPGILFLANPNNPTGELIASETIRQIAQQTSALVVVDECYHEFAGETCLPLLAECPNLLVLRSLSKSFAMAGLRAGYAIAHPQVIAALTKVDQIFSVNLAAQRCGVAALRAIEYYRPLFARTMALRTEWHTTLQSLGLRVFPSRANILLVDSTAFGPGNLAASLRPHGIQVADFHDRPGIRNCARISIDDEPALARLTAALRQSLPTLR